MTPPPDLLDKDALIAVLLGRIEARDATIVKLAARVAELEAGMNRPRKGPGNSSVPPSQGFKPSGGGGSKAKRKPHRGAHRALHPDPTHKLTVAATRCGCGADVSGVAQKARQTYDCIEIPPIKP